MIESRLIDLMTKDSDITSFVADRIDAFERNDKLPAIVYESSPTEQEEYIDGSLSEVGETKITFECWAKTYAKAKSLSKAVKKFTNSVNDDQIQLIEINSGDDEKDESAFVTTLEVTIYHIVGE